MSEFDTDYWENHWGPARLGHNLPVSPYLPKETANLASRTALDAGCGAGTEALWLADHGWEVTAADISATAVAIAKARASAAGRRDRIDWVNVDLGRWEPNRQWDLVVTNYAHSDAGQLDFYRRISSWVTPGGTLLIVGHLHDHGHPTNATTTLPGISHLLSAPCWRIETSYENTRTVSPGGRAVQLRDVVVRASRLC